MQADRQAGWQVGWQAGRETGSGQKDTATILIMTLLIMNVLIRTIFPLQLASFFVTFLLVQVKSF